MNPNQILLPTSEQRQQVAAYLRGLADEVENPTPGTLLLKKLDFDMERNVEHMGFVEPTGFPMGQLAALGQQVKITVGWGEPKYEWGWQ